MSEQEKREPGAEDIDIFDPEHQGAWWALFKMLDQEVEQEREDYV